MTHNRGAEYRSGGRIHTKRTGKTSVGKRSGTRSPKAASGSGALSKAPPQETAAATQRKKDNPHGRIMGGAGTPMQTLVKQQETAQTSMANAQAEMAGAPMVAKPSAPAAPVVPRQRAGRRGGPMRY